MESTEFAFDGPTLVEWPLRMYGPTCTKCGVKFCGSTGTVCGSCTPWKDTMNDAVEIEYPPLTLRTRIWLAAYCRGHEHREAGHKIRGALWRAIADTI